MMSQHNIPIILSPADGSKGSVWARLDPVTEEDNLSPVTDSDVAQLVDNIFALIPCNNPDDLQGGQAKELLDELSGDEARGQEIISRATSLWNLTSCMDLAEDGSYTAKVRLYRSHVCRSYEIRLTNGYEQGRKTVKEVAKTVLQVNDKAVTLDLPPSPKQCNADGTVKVPGNFDCNHPYTYSGSTVNFAKVVATAHFEYDTEYDEIAILVPGLGGGKPGTCHLFCKYEGLMVELEIKPPEDEGTASCINTGGDGDDDGSGCFRREYYEERCSCTDKISNEYSKTVEVGCPSGMAEGSVIEDDQLHRTYVDCGGDGSEVGNPEFYEKTCCEPVPADMGLPRCKKVYSNWNGEGGLDQEIIDFYIREYGEGNVRFIGVGTDDGVCGKHIVEQVINAGQCCDGVPPIAWDHDNSIEIIADNSQGVVHVTGGTGINTWKVRGDGFYTDASHTQRDIIAGNSITIYTKNSCGSAAVFVTDGCSSTSVDIRSSEGRWVLVGTFRPRDQVGVEIDELFNCITNSYVQDSGNQIDSVVGKYMISFSPDSPPENWLWLMNPWCSCTDLGPSTYLDPIVGVFDIPATSGVNHNIGEVTPCNPGIKWRIGYGGVAGGDVPIWEWKC